MNSELTPSPFQHFLLSVFVSPTHAFWNCEKKFQECWNFFNEAKKILILSHKRPDPDTLGANLALAEALKFYGKNVDQACKDPIPQAWQWLMEGEWKRNPNFSDYDSIICVDTSSESQVGFWEDETLSKHPRVMVVDHHSSQTFFGTHHLVFEGSPATCYILSLFMLWARWPLNPKIADALLFGFYYDTGSFQHNNTDASVLRLAGHLLKHSSSHKKIVQSIFYNFSLSKLKLWGIALERTQLSASYFAGSALTPRDYEITQSQEEDSQGIVTYLSHAQEAKAAVFLSEYPKGRIKGSLRSIEKDFDVETLAKAWGGGGHKEAAGFEKEGRIQIQSTWHWPPLSSL